MDKLVIASRTSKLAMCQAGHIKRQLEACYPRLMVEIRGMLTRGDQILDRALREIGGKGLFIKELEIALQGAQADLAVHSIKDVPMLLPDGFALAAICEREDPRDALISYRYPSLVDLPKGAIVGTSSLRREAQLRYRFPGLVIKPLRGNVQTRLSKLENGEFDAIILAAAGLKRLGLASLIRCELSPEESLPAAGQGALGIEICENRDDLMEYLSILDHPDTRDCVLAERSLSRALGGSCRIPLGSFATLDSNTLTLSGLVAKPDGSKLLTAYATAPREYAEELGRAVAKKLQDAGASSVIALALQT